MLTCKSVVQTQPLFDDAWSLFEYEARTQLGLGDDWRIDSSCTSFTAGVESLIDRLDKDISLCDGERWSQLQLSELPQVQLPKDIFLVSMFRKVGDRVERKAGLVEVSL